MKHLTIKHEQNEESTTTGKMLTNWSVAATHIYSDDASVQLLKQLLSHEAAHKRRPMIIERLTVRLLSLMKNEIRQQLEEDIAEISQAKGI